MPTRIGAATLLRQKPLKQDAKCSPAGSWKQKVDTKYEYFLINWTDITTSNSCSCRQKTCNIDFRDDNLTALSKLEKPKLGEQNFLKAIHPDSLIFFMCAMAGLSNKFQPNNTAAAHTLILSQRSRFLPHSYFETPCTFHKGVPEKVQKLGQQLNACICVFHAASWWFHIPTPVS